MNKNYFFEDKDGEQRRKALVSYRADKGQGYCMRCYKRTSYKHGHHITCSKSKYYDRKDRDESMKKNMLWTNTNSIPITDPVTGAVVNIKSLPKKLTSPIKQYYNEEELPSKI